ncbi:MAG: TfoX/Sxy family protein [Jhaorihella sp.]
MPYSEHIAETMRADLGAAPGLSEMKMFGGLCFLLHGNMVCGVMRDAAMYRPGKAARPEALALPGVEPMEMGGRRMGGFVQVAGDALATATRARLTELSLAHAASLPPKG